MSNAVLLDLSPVLLSLVQSLVLTRLDYGNATLAAEMEPGLPVTGHGSLGPGFGAGSGQVTGQSPDPAVQCCEKL